MYSPIARSVVVLRRGNRTIINLLGNVFIHNAARLRLSRQMAEPYKEQMKGVLCFQVSRLGHIYYAMLLKFSVIQSFLKDWNHLYKHSWNASYKWV